jgi:hypothetical protein
LGAGRILRDLDCIDSGDSCTDRDRVHCLGSTLLIFDRLLGRLDGLQGVDVEGWRWWACKLDDPQAVVFLVTDNLDH